MIIGAPLLLLSKRMGQLLDAMPTTWLVALQVYRVFGSQWLAYWLLGLLPGLWALTAGTGDVLTGLFAVPVAKAIVAGTANRPVSTSPVPAGNAHRPGSSPRSQYASHWLPKTR